MILDWWMESETMNLRVSKQSEIEKLPLLGLSSGDTTDYPDRRSAIFVKPVIGSIFNNQLFNSTHIVHYVFAGK